MACMLPGMITQNLPEEGSVWLTRDESIERETVWIVEVIPSPWTEGGHLVRYQPYEPAEDLVRDMELEAFLARYGHEEEFTSD